jgi:hypothetical protein
MQPLTTTPVTGPPIVLRQLGKVATQNCTAHAPTSINHQDPAVTFLLKELAEQHVILEDLQCHNRASKNLPPSIDLEDRLESTKITIHNKAALASHASAVANGKAAILSSVLLAIKRRKKKIQGTVQISSSSFLTQSNTASCPVQ